MLDTIQRDILLADDDMDDVMIFEMALERTTGLIYLGMQARPDRPRQNESFGLAFGRALYLAVTYIMGKKELIKC